MNLFSFFTQPIIKRQKQYEAIRAVVVDKIPIQQSADTFGYSPNTMHTMICDAKKGRLVLFPEIKKGPSERRTPLAIIEKILQFRKQQLSTPDINKKLLEQKIVVSVSTIERIVKEVGFKKLQRRTYQEMGLTKKKKTIPQRADKIKFEKLEPFNMDCPVAGIFFFIPYIIESKIIDIVKKCKLPQSGVINSLHACLSMLALKLIGNKRLSHMDNYDQEPGLGLFAGLNVLPKSTYMSTYSCRTGEVQINEFQKQIIKCFFKKYPELYNGEFINLDFHSIPHYGEESEMGKVWCGAKGRAIKGANTIFAQDSQTKSLIYARADILRKEESQEIEKFVNYWKNIKGDINETLVFDCKFTRYDKLDQLTDSCIKFITLRKRNKNLIEEVWKIPDQEWKKIRIENTKRKYKTVMVYEQMQVQLQGCKNTFRQIIVKDHGRERPTFIITSNHELSLSKIMEVYGKRWHIENKIAEMILFFNLNALSSPLMIRIHFDILWTLIADTLYHLFAKDLRRFEAGTSQTIFRKFINMPGRITYDGEKFQIRIRKRSHTPVLLGVKKLSKPFSIPWLNNKTIEIIWTS